MVGSEQNRPAPKDDPCLFFFSCGLSIFFCVDLVFLRGEGLVGIFLEKHHYPFDLQVVPRLGTQAGSWPLLDKS